VGCDFGLMRFKGLFCWFWVCVFGILGCSFGLVYWILTIWLFGFMFLVYFGLVFRFVAWWIYEVQRVF
jgi:hypothetical protein